MGIAAMADEREHFDSDSIRLWFVSIPNIFLERQIRAQMAQKNTHNMFRSVAGPETLANQPHYVRPNLDLTSEFN